MAKREHAFALKARAALPPLLGRTRSGRPHASPSDGPRASKRPKRLESGDGHTPPKSAGGTLAVPVDPLPPSTPPVDSEAPNTVAGRDEPMDESSSTSVSEKTISSLAVAVPIGSDGCCVPNVEEGPLNLASSSDITVTISLAENEAIKNSVNADGDGLEKVGSLGLLTSSELKVTVTQEPGSPLPIAVENVGSVAPSEKHARRLTRSVLKACAMEKEEVCVDKDKISRRFTRSLLKNKEEGYGEEISSSSSPGSEQTVRRHNSVDGLVDSIDVKKMELKMSKKISLTNPPRNVRDLLATALLEGLPVMYIIPTSKKPVLKGVIKGSNILCFCTSCNGSNAVPAHTFEMHAGSTKKHPSDFIYLENGNSLHDVLRACAGAPLDMLETVIQNAIGPVPEKNPSTCLKCNGSLVLETLNFLLCDSCKSNQPQDTPSPSHASPNSIRTPSSASLSVSHTYPSKSASVSKRSNNTGRLTKKDLGLHKLVFMNDILPEGTEVSYVVGGKIEKTGYIKGEAICCKCCGDLMSPSQWEAHAGHKTRRKPYNYIYTSNGVSLHELSVSLSKERKLSASDTDDLCNICRDGGDLLVCDLCPRAFHIECIGLPTIPEGDWHCQFCINLHEREKYVAHNNNAIAAGRVAGVDPIEQIFKRCIRIVTITEDDLGGCALCKLKDFSKSKFDDRTVLLCDQCEREYHIGCLKDCGMADLKELPEGEWFCCTDCCTIHYALQEMILRGAEPLPDSDVAVIKKKHEARGLSLEMDNITCRLLAGRNATPADQLLLSGAVAIFHESFDPIVDANTKRDLIPPMVNGASVGGHDYTGMYCAVLTAGSSVVSVGLLRVLGSEVAELPLVATSRDLQGQGYFQVLFSCIEKMLVSLKIKHFLLPAAVEAETIWTKKFSFARLSSDQVDEYLNGAHLTAFNKTAILHKRLPLCP